MCAKLLILESPGKVKKVQEILGPPGVMELPVFRKKNAVDLVH